jgi:uncharacterized protein YaiL (DUF2058 family)
MTNKFSRLYQNVWYPKVGDVVRLKGYTNTIDTYAKVIQVDEDYNIKLEGGRLGIGRWFAKDNAEYIGRQYPAWVLDKISRRPKF